MKQEEQTPSLARLVAWSALSLVALMVLASMTSLLFAPADGGVAAGIVILLVLLAAIGLVACSLAYFWRELRRLDRWLFGR